MTNQIKNKKGEVIFTYKEKYLSQANLVGADLSGADLGEANLFKADLSGADLTDADLRRANLVVANLTDAIKAIRDGAKNV